MLKQWGFTLIEILVVMLIISIVTSIAMLTIHTNQIKQLESFAQTITNYLTLAEEEALLRSATLGFGFTDTQFRFYLFTEQKKAPWQLLADDSVLKPHALPHHANVTVMINNNAVPNTQQPQLIISPNGEATAFTILISDASETPRFKIIGQDNGAIKMEAASDEQK